MTNKVTKYGIMIIAAVLLIAMAFAGAGAATMVDINNADEWKENVSSGAFAALKEGDVINLTGNIDFEGATEDVAVTGTLHPNIEGNGFTISNFNISGGNGFGLFGDYYGTRIANLTLRNFSVTSGGYGVGGLVGFVSSAVTVTIENVRAEFGTVTAGDKCVSGLVGWANYSSFVRCNMTNCTVASTGSSFVGGLVGSASKSASFEMCGVENTSVYAGTGSVGGLAGDAPSASKIGNCSVVNCVIASGGGYVGGLVGSAGPAIKIGNCSVVNCVIASGKGYVGGLVGIAASASGCSDNSVISSAVKGTGSDVRLDCGNGKDVGCTMIGNNFIRNQSGDIPQPLIAVVKDSDTPSSSLVTAITITSLSGIGTLDNPQYACGYVIDSSPLIFNLEVAGKEAYAGTVKVGAHTIDPYYVAGYVFNGWNISSADGTNLTNAAGELLSGVLGYTNATGYWNNVSGLTVNLFANWTVNQTTKVAESNVSVFGNDNYTTVRDDAVISILLESVNNVTGTVTFTADNTSTSSVLPTISGMNAPVTVSIFDITADNDGSGTTSSFYVNVTFANLADKDKVKFFHYTVGSGWDSTPLTSTIVTEYASENKVLYKVTVNSFSPFGVGIYTALPPQYTPSSSSKQSGYTVILQEGQVAPTQIPTSAPTVAQTAAPTEKPAVPTVAPTANPTAQPTQTQQSPAPIVGLIAGLGVAAVLLRLRK